MTHEHVIKMFERFYSKQFNIETHPINSLNYILKHSILYEEFYLSEMIKKELERRIKYNVCEHDNILRTNELRIIYDGKVFYCKGCNSKLIFEKNGITKYSGNIKKLN